MTPKNCIVLDDEQHSIDILTEYIEKMSNLKLIGTYKNPIEAIPLIQNTPIDIAFLDVQMPNITGLQFLKLLNPSTKVVLCTAYSQYAVDGFELNVLDYLLKPISFERFLKCIQKLNDLPNNDLPKNNTEINNEYIFVKADTKGKYIKIQLKDINYIEGLGNYQKIKLADSQIVCQLKLKNLEQQLSPFGFVRVHKSYLVPFAKISQIEGNKLSIGNDKIPIGDSFKESIFELISEKIMN